MAAHACLRAVTLRVGASHVPSLLSSLSLHEAHLIANPGDAHLCLQPGRQSSLRRLCLEGFVLQHADLRNCESLTELTLSVPHTPHLHRARSEGASTSSSDGGDSASDEEPQPAQEHPTVLLPAGIASLTLCGRVPTLLSEVPVVGGGEQDVVWDLRGLRELRSLSLRDGNRTLLACVWLPYTLRTLGLGDAWALKALRAWAPRLQNLRELRLGSVVECSSGLRETLAQLPSLRMLCWIAENENVLQR